MGWNVLDVPGARIADTDDAPVFQIGLKCCARNTTTGYSGEFVYMQGVTSCVVGAFVLLDYDSGAVTLLIDTDVGGVGIAMAATTGSLYGWFQVRGKAAGSLAASCADNAELYTTAVGGVVDDSPTGQFQIYGARCAETVTGAAVGEVEINYPNVAGPDGA